MVDHFCDPVSGAVLLHVKVTDHFRLLAKKALAFFRNSFFSRSVMRLTLGTFLIPVFFYAYTSILGRNIFALDVGTFVLSTLIAFYSVYKLTLSCKLKAYTLLLCTLAAVLFICFLVFSYHPPELPIFVNLEKA